MTKNEYLAELKSRLVSLPVEERDAAIRYYHEFFEDAGPGREQEIMDELGSPASLAQNIIDEANHTEESSTEYIPARYGEKAPPPPKRPSPERKAQNSTNRSVLWILVILLFSPVLLVVAIVLFCIFIAVLAVVFSLWIACMGIVLGLVLGGIFTVAAGISQLFTSPLGLAAVGIGLVLIAVGLLAIIPFVFLTTKVFPAVVRGFVNIISTIFNHKKVVAS